MAVGPLRVNAGAEAGRACLMLVFIIGLVLFLGVHCVSIVARPWRDRMLGTLGANGWRGAYSVVALIGLVLIIWGWGDARAAAPLLYEPPVWIKHLTALLMLFSALAMGVYMVPAGRLKPMLKHPMLLSVKIWAFAHLLANGDLASLLLFGTFLAWAVADRISLKRRAAAVAAPGSALNDVIALGLGLVIYAALVFGGHAWLFGVAPLPVG